MSLAWNRTSHFFRESDVRRIVSENIRHLLKHCSHSEKSVQDAAHSILMNYGRGGLPFVQQQIADGIHSLMADMLSQSTECRSVMIRLSWCIEHLQMIVSSLTKPQQQQWAPMLVRVLLCHRAASTRRKKFVVSILELLWRRDSNARQTFAEAHQQLREIRMDANFQDVHAELTDIMLGC